MIEVKMWWVRYVVWWRKTTAARWYGNMRR